MGISCFSLPRLMACRVYYTPPHSYIHCTQNFVHAPFHREKTVQTERDPALPIWVLKSSCHRFLLFHCTKRSVHRRLLRNYDNATAFLIIAHHTYHRVLLREWPTVRTESRKGEPCIKVSLTACLALFRSFFALDLDIDGGVHATTVQQPVQIIVLMMHAGVHQPVTTFTRNTHYWYQFFHSGPFLSQLQHWG